MPLVNPSEEKHFTPLNLKRSLSPLYIKYLSQRPIFDKSGKRLGIETSIHKRSMIVGSATTAVPKPNSLSHRHKVRNLWTSRLNYEIQDCHKHRKDVGYEDNSFPLWFALTLKDATLANPDTFVDCTVADCRTGAAKNVFRECVTNGLNPYLRRLFRFKFFTCQEYGEQKERLHYHMMLFVQSYDLDKLNKRYTFCKVRLEAENERLRKENPSEWASKDRYNTTPYYVTRYLSGKPQRSLQTELEHKVSIILTYYWDFKRQLGHIDKCMQPTAASARYITKYVTKTQDDISNGRCPFHRQSRGLGESFYIDHEQAIADGQCTGIKPPCKDYYCCGLPYYWKKKAMQKYGKWDAYVSEQYDKCLSNFTGKVWLCESHKEQYSMDGLDNGIDYKQDEKLYIPLDVYNNDILPYTDNVRDYDERALIELDPSDTDVSTFAEGIERWNNAIDSRMTVDGKVRQRVFAPCTETATTVTDLHDSTPRDIPLKEYLGTTYPSPFLTHSEIAEQLRKARLIERKRKHNLEENGVPMENVIARKCDEYIIKSYRQFDGSVNLYIRFFGCYRGIGSKSYRFTDMKSLEKRITFICDFVANHHAFPTDNAVTFDAVNYRRGEAVKPIEYNPTLFNN